MRMTAAMIGEEKTKERAAKLPAAPTTSSSLGRCLPARQLDDRHRQPGSEGDERRLRADHDSHPDRGQAGQE